jgi:hypothetical protein
MLNTVTLQLAAGVVRTNVIRGAKIVLYVAMAFVLGGMSGAYIDAALQTVGFPRGEA